jgi:hypothetical protein
MRKPAAIALSTLLTLASGCSNDTLHLVSGEKGDPAEIRIDGDEGEAAWSWGPDNFTVEVTVLKNGLASAPGGARGSELVLQLADGTRLEFAGEYRALVCQRGCDSLHLPVAWLVRRD